MLAVLFTFIASLSVLGLLGWIISSSLADFAEQQQKLVDAGAQPMGEALAAMGNDYMLQLKDNGINIYQGEYCADRLLVFMFYCHYIVFHTPCNQLSICGYVLKLHFCACSVIDNACIVS